MRERPDHLLDEDQPLLDEPEREPVVAGLAYLLVLIVGLCAVAGWLVFHYSRG